MRRLFFFTLLVNACDNAAVPARDAASDPAAVEVAPTTDDAPGLLAVDFAVEGCPSFDPEAMTCIGRVPLSLRFVPLATATVTKYLWDFGDASPPDTGSAPIHRYASPGTFTVKVVATGITGGFVTKTHAGFVVAMANAAGNPCDSDVQCDTGLFCLCPTSASCNGSLARGVCSSSCRTGTCNKEQVCAGLLTAASPSGAAMPWQAPLCLPMCSRDTDCAPGSRCRTLPPWPADGAWVQGCFGDVPSDIGEPCTDATGRLRNDLCSGGLCVAAGAKGLCSATCQGAACPPGSTCALMGNGQKVCLRPCAGSFACARDPLLTCVVAGPGDLGFSLVKPTATESAASYCAPKPCASDDICLPTGSCLTQGTGSHCAPRMY